MQVNSAKLQDKYTSGGTRLDTNPSISTSPFNVLDGRKVRNFFRPLTDFVFRPAGCLSHPPHQLGGGVGLVADDPTMK